LRERLGHRQPPPAGVGSVPSVVVVVIVVVVHILWLSRPPPRQTDSATGLEAIGVAPDRLVKVLTLADVPPSSAPWASIVRTRSIDDPATSGAAVAGPRLARADTKQVRLAGRPAMMSPLYLVLSSDYPSADTLYLVRPSRPDPN